MKSFPTFSLIFSRVSDKNLARFLSLPPYSSFLLLYKGDKNSLTKKKCAPWISTPSKPAFFALKAALAKLFSILIMSSLVISFDFLFWSGIGKELGAYIISDLVFVFIPRCTNCIKIFAPFLCTMSTNFLNSGIYSSLSKRNTGKLSTRL